MSGVAKVLVGLLLAGSILVPCVSMNIVRGSNFDKSDLQRRIDDLRERQFWLVESDFIDELHKAQKVIVQDNAGDEHCLSAEEKASLIESQQMRHGAVGYQVADGVMTIVLPCGLEYFSILLNYMTLTQSLKSQGYSYAGIIAELSACDFADECFTQILELADDFVVESTIKGLIHRYIEYGDLGVPDIARLPSQILRELRVQHFLKNRAWFDDIEENFFVNDLISCHVLPSLQEFGSENFIELRDEDVAHDYARHQDCGVFYHDLPEGAFKASLRKKIIEVSCDYADRQDFFSWLMQFRDRDLVWAAVEQLDGVAARFVEHARCKAQCAQLPEGIFKLLVRKQFHHVHNTFIDNFDVVNFFDTLKKACEKEVKGVVNLSSCGLKSLDAVWDYLLYFNYCICPITKLYLDDNQLQALPENIDVLFDLTTLSVYDNHLRVLPAAVCNLKNVKTLMVQNNELAVLPDGMEKLEQLERLYISQNKISQLPSGLAQLAGLHSLYMKGNCIKSLRDGFFDAMHGLNFLVLDYHLMSSVSPQMRAQLQTMDRELSW